MAQLKLRNPFDEASVATSPLRVEKTVSLAVDDEQEDAGARTEQGEGPQPTIRLSVDLERPLHRRLRRWALERDQTASDVIRELLTSALDGAGY